MSKRVGFWFITSIFLWVMGVMGLAVGAAYCISFVYIIGGVSLFAGVLPALYAVDISHEE